MSADGILYLDSSALVKLVVAEPETEALRRYIKDYPRLTSCALAHVEVIRRAAVRGEQTTTNARRLLRSIALVAMDEPLLEAAAQLSPPTLRALDAIHVAAAMSLGSDLASFVTYDRRMQEAARALGLPVEAPA